MEEAPMGDDYWERRQAEQEQQRQWAREERQRDEANRQEWQRYYDRQDKEFKAQRDTEFKAQQAAYRQRTAEVGSPFFERPFARQYAPSANIPAEQPIPNARPKKKTPRYILIIRAIILFGVVAWYLNFALQYKFGHTIDYGSIWTALTHAIR